MFRVSVGNGSEVAPEEINVTFDDVKVIMEIFPSIRGGNKIIF